jgi:hypothetical protein
MKITTVTVRRLINTGNYENTAWELTALVDDSERAEVVAAALAATIMQMARAELLRRYPDESERHWHTWLPEDSRGDA